MADLAPDVFRQQLLATLPFSSLEVHSLDEELSKVSSDMYVSLALANMQIFLVGVTLVAVLVGVVSAFSWWVSRRTAHRTLQET